MRIKKVKVNKAGKIIMEWEQQAKSGSGWDEYSFCCSEDARPEFHDALKVLAQDVIEMCELPDNYLEKITVKGVSFSWSQDIMGAVIVASMKLDKSHQSLNLNTPHKASEMYNPDTPEDEKQLLSSECYERLEVLLQESELYIQGERAQGTLFPVEVSEEVNNYVN